MISVEVRSSGPGPRQVLRVILRAGVLWHETPARLSTLMGQRWTRQGTRRGRSCRVADGVGILIRRES